MLVVSRTCTGTQNCWYRRNGWLSRHWMPERRTSVLRSWCSATASLDIRLKVDSESIITSFYSNESLLPADRVAVIKTCSTGYFLHAGPKECASHSKALSFSRLRIESAFTLLLPLLLPWIFLFLWSSAIFPYVAFFATVEVSDITLFGRLFECYSTVLKPFVSTFCALILLSWPIVCCCLHWQGCSRMRLWEKIFLFRHFTVPSNARFSHCDPCCESTFCSYFLAQRSAACHLPLLTSLI